MLAARMGHAMARPESPGSVPALVGRDKTTGQLPAFLDRQTGNSQSERNGPALPEAFSHPKGPTVEQLWPKLYEEMVKSSGEQGEASKNSLQGEAQGRYDGETSSELPEQEMKHPTSHEEQMKIVQHAMEKVKANPGGDPKIRENARRLLAKIKGEQSSEPEVQGQESSVLRRKLEPSDNSKVCLDTSGSNFDKEIISPTQEGVPGQEMRADLFLNVKNNCGEQADNADFIVTAAITCPPGYTGKNYGQAYRNTNPANIPDRGQAVQNTAIFTTGECTQVDQNGTPLDSVLPTTFTVSVLTEAIGHDSSKSLQPVGYVMNII
jgi:hypothetical protein